MAVHTTLGWEAKTLRGAKFCLPSAQAPTAMWINRAQAKALSD